MDKVRCVKTLIIMMISVFLLSACGSGQEKEAEAASGIQWVLKETKLPDADAALKEFGEQGHSPMELTCGIANDVVYRVVWIYGEGMEITGSCVQRLAPPYTIWENFPIYGEEWIEGQKCYVSEASITQNGIVQMLLRDIGEQEENAYRAEWSLENGYTVEDITGEAVDAGFFEKKAEINTGSVWQHWADEKTGEDKYLCGSSPDGKFCIWTLESNRPVFTAQDVFMGVNDRVAFIDDTKGFLCTTAGIWKFDIGLGQMETVMTYYSQGISLDKVCGVFVREDGLPCQVASNEGDLFLLELSEDTESADKVELELAVVIPSPFLKQAVVEFNRQSEDCQIVLRSPDKPEEFSDFRLRIQAEVSSGSGPALLSGDVIDLNQAAEMGFLRDLTVDFEEEKESMWENVWSTGEVNGRCYGIPYSFSVQALVTSAEFCGSRDTWTVEEMMQCMRESGADTAVSSYNGSVLFAILMLNGGIDSSLIDMEAGICHLDDGRVLSVLEFAAQYGDERPQENSGLRIAEGEIFTKIHNICNLSEAKIMSALFQGEEVYIGFPVARFGLGDGENSNQLSGSSISINQSCQYPEEAVSFIKYLLDSESQNKLAKEAAYPGTLGFPVRTEALEYVFSHALEEDSGAASLLQNYGGYEYKDNSLSGESLEKVRRLLEGARPQETGIDVIWEICAEEAETYFTGEKTAQEVCDTLQRRIQLYLNEIQ